MKIVQMYVITKIGCLNASFNTKICSNAYFQQQNLLKCIFLTIKLAQMHISDNKISSNAYLWQQNLLKCIFLTIKFAQMHISDNKIRSNAYLWQQNLLKCIFLTTTIIVQGYVFNNKNSSKTTTNITQMHISVNKYCWL